MADEIDKELGDGDTFDRAYVEKLRREAAKYRDKYAEYRDAFADLDDLEKQFMLDTVRTVGRDPQAGALEFRRISQQMLGDSFFEGLDLPTPASKEDEGSDDSLEEEGDAAMVTKEEVQELLEAQRRQQEEAASKAELDRMVAEIHAELEAAGIERDSQGWVMALNTAAHVTDGDVAKAVDITRKALDLPAPEAGAAGEDAGDADGGDGDDGVAGDEAGASGLHPTTVDASGGAGAARETPKNWIEEAKESGENLWEAARARTEARLKAANAD